jgi:hypothetical protein
MGQPKDDSHEGSVCLSAFQWIEIALDSMQDPFCQLTSQASWSFSFSGLFNVYSSFFHLRELVSWSGDGVKFPKANYG